MPVCARPRTRPTCTCCRTCGRAGSCAGRGSRWPPRERTGRPPSSALEVATGAWTYTLGRRSAAAFVAFLQLLLAACPDTPAVAVVCDNDSIHHAKAVTAYLADQPRLRLLFGARYSPHDNPVQRIWAALKAFLANTAVTWPGRPRQVHAFFRQRSPTQILTTAAPWASPWLPKHYAQNFRQAA
ncbi:transposase [Streptomyces sp. NBC_01669]|nr:transposase [Streptomyces sp. NBC_01669]